MNNQKREKQNNQKREAEKKARQRIFLLFQPFLSFSTTFKTSAFDEV
jgi:hypothetical protein